MKRLVVAKPAPYRVLGHVYEHGVVDALTCALRDQGYYIYVDYLLFGTTFTGGVMVLEIECLHEEVWEAARSLVADLELDVANAPLWVSQVAAEQQTKHRIADKAALESDIRALHALPWRPLSEPIEGLASESRPYAPIVSGDKHPLSTLVFDFELEKSYAEQDPSQVALFRMVALAVLHNVSAVAAERYGLFEEYVEYFGDAEEGTYGAQVGWLRPEGYEQLDVGDFANYEQVYIEVSKGMLADGAFDRLLAMLRNIDYESDGIIPSFRDTEQASLMVLSESEWRRIATRENLDKLFAHARVHVGLTE